MNSRPVADPMAHCSEKQRLNANGPEDTSAISCLTILRFDDSSDSSSLRTLVFCTWALGHEHWLTGYGGPLGARC